jgi:diguanylate cyclase (GGDEF)-like protein
MPPHLPGPEVLLVTAAVLQIAAAVIAVRALPHGGPYRFLWIALSLALMLMVPRRIVPLLGGAAAPPDGIDASLALLVSALMVFSMVGLGRMLHAIDATHQQLALLATTDPLTGVANRRTVLARLESELERATRTGQPVALLMVDLDHFKAVNDRHGHGVGDEVLVGIATRCKGGLRSIDACGRIGGEEFVVVLPDTDLDAAAAVAERLRAAVAGAPIETSAGPVGVTISLGVAVDRLSAAQGTSPRDPAATARRLLERADTALYLAKADGRNCVRLAGRLRAALAS